jgi:hypothetical protein
MLQNLELGERSKQKLAPPLHVLEMAEPRGAELAAELGLHPAEYATDAVMACWHDEAGHTWLSQREMFTQLTTANETLISQARRIVQQWGIAQRERT